MFKIGLSTASFFCRRYTEDALSIIPALGGETTEVFMGSFSEYEEEMGKEFVAHKRGEVHSIHSLNQNYEPELFNALDRTREDADAMLRKVLHNGRLLGAKYYTFHGPARLKKQPYIIHWPTFGPKVQRVQGICEEYGITLSYENVHWAYYNYPTFYRNLKEYAPRVRCTLDIKQAMQAGVDVYDFLEDMGGAVCTVHVEDYKEDGSLCLPGKGVFDFVRLFVALKQQGFEGAVLIEAYYGDYQDEAELTESLDYLKQIRADIYGQKE